MAYKRPISQSQSFIIAGLWIAFATLVLYTQPWTLSLLGILLISGFIVFYPIRKSLRQRTRGNSPTRKRRSK